MVHRKTLLLYISVVCFLLIFCYALFEGRKLIMGPQLTVLSPRDESATSSAAVLVSGTAHDIAFLSIDGHEAYVDTAGYFSEVISPPPGYSVLTVAARDRFGRIVSKTVHFTVTNYCPLNA